MLCPACNNSMIVVEYHQIELDYCTHCHGLWFDSGELDLMFKSAEIDDKLLGDLNRLPTIKTNEAERKCPICHRLMSKNSIGTKQPIVVDVCQHGDGMFFDGGEIHQLIKQVSSNQANITSSENSVVDFLKDVFKAPE